MGVNVADGENVIFCWGIATDGTGSPLMGYFDSGVLKCQTPRNNNPSYSIQYLIVKYTKTTDTAGSGTWTPEGSYAVHYSTSEQVIGTWTNGKPIYRRIINPTVNIGINTINHGIADLEECISIRGMCKYNNTGEQLPLPYVSTNIGYVIALGNVTNTTCLVDVASGFSSIQDCKIIIEYTKTTD